MNDRILNFLKSNGPSTNIDICRGIGLQSYVVDALLADMVGKTVRKSHKRLGSTRVYYLPGDEEQARMRVYKSLEPSQQEFLKRLEGKKVLTSSDISEDQIEEWQDFMVPFSDGAQNAWHWFELSPASAKKLLGPQIVLTKKAERKPEPAKPEQKMPAPPAAAQKPKGSANVVKADAKAANAAQVKVPESGFTDRVALWLQSQNAVVLSKNEDKEGFELEVSMPTPLGEQVYLVVVKSPKKKKLGTNDVSDAYAKAVSKKAPVILVSSTGFAKSAEKSWSKGYKNLITLIDGKNL